MKKLSKPDLNNSFTKYLPEIVYGGSDGSVSYFTLMAGAYGAGLSIKMLIAIGVSNVFADAFSMASADYLSEDSKEGRSKSSEIKSATVTFFSFVLLGSLPLLPTIYAYSTLSPSSPLPLSTFLFSTLLTLVGFTYIGYLRGRVLRRNILRTMLQSIIICSLSASVAYFIGEYLVKFI
jgi:vacuolar iron transporter family protein